MDGGGSRGCSTWLDRRTALLNSSSSASSHSTSKDGWFLEPDLYNLPMHTVIRLKRFVTFCLCHFFPATVTVLLPRMLHKSAHCGSCPKWTLGCQLPGIHDADWENKGQKSAGSPTFEMARLPGTIYWHKTTGS